MRLNKNVVSRSAYVRSVKKLIKKLLIIKLIIKLKIVFCQKSDKKWYFATKCFFDYFVFCHGLLSDRGPPRGCGVCGVIATPLSGLRSSSFNHNSFYRVKHSFAKRSFSYSGPFLWNSLPSSLTLTKSLTMFRKSLKTHFREVRFRALLLAS